MKTVIEAGHFYACTGPTNVSLQGWDIGKKLAAEKHAAVALFIDDYHNEQSFTLPHEKPGPAGTEKQMKSEADHVFYEKAFADQSLAAILELHEAGKVKIKKDIVSLHGMRLGELSMGKTVFNPVCAFMDYLFVKEKAKLGPAQITVLPLPYQPEQRQLFTVLSELAIPELKEYTAVLFAADGTIAEMSL